MEKLKALLTTLHEKINALLAHAKGGLGQLLVRLKPLRERTSPALRRASESTRLGLKRVSIAMNPVSTRIKALLDRSGISGKAAEFWKKHGPRQGLSWEQIKSLDPAAVLAAVSTFFQRRGASLFGKTLTVALCAYFLADVLVWIIDQQLAQPSALRANRRAIAPISAPVNPEVYTPIVTRNLFNSQGLIPGEEAPGQDRGGAPVRTSLPFKLVGTLVLRDELRSIATIEDSSASTVYPVRTQDEIPGKARILTIEPRRVIFVNSSSGRREYIELPEEAGAGTPRISVGGPKTSGVSQTAPNTYVISRSKVDESFKDLNSVLTQAKCVPNLKGGQPAGFRCFQIVKGSIYDQLGMKDDDVICGLNGQPVNDLNKAVELMNELRTANDVELCIERNGVQQTFSYSVQ